MVDCWNFTGERICFCPGCVLNEPSDIGSVVVRGSCYQMLEPGVFQPVVVNDGLEKLGDVGPSGVSGDL